MLADGLKDGRAQRVSREWQPRARAPQRVANNRGGAVDQFQGDITRAPCPTVDILLCVGPHVWTRG